VTVHDIAERLGLEDNVVDRAVQRALDLGWCVADVKPPHSIRLSAALIDRLG
jgi:hypothetical protein